MCLGMPGRVLEIVDEAKDVAAVEISGVRRNVSIALLRGADRPLVGDWVLVHVGMAMSRIDEAEAMAAQEMLEGFGDIFELEDGQPRPEVREHFMEPAI